jgi:hypothetical protein
MKMNIDHKSTGHFANISTETKPYRLPYMVVLNLMIFNNQIILVLAFVKNCDVHI